jgi:hypothetical protein
MIGGHIPSLKHIVAALEDGIIVLSGPALAMSGIIAGVDLVTGGNILKSISWLALVWAITLLLTLDFQVLALGVRAHQVYGSPGKGRGQKALEILLVVVMAAAISYVSIQMQSVIARVNSEPGVSIDQATAQLGINPIALIWERSTLVLLLIFMSGWLRESEARQAEAPAQPPLAPVSASTPAISNESVQLILAKLAKLDALEQTIASQITIAEQPPPVFQLPTGASSQHAGSGTDAQTSREASSQEVGTEETMDEAAAAKLAAAYRALLREGGEVSASQLALTAHVRKATAITWLRSKQEAGGDA